MHFLGPQKPTVVRELRRGRSTSKQLSITHRHWGHKHEAEKIFALEKPGLTRETIRDTIASKDCSGQCWNGDKCENKLGEQYHCLHTNLIALEHLTRQRFWEETFMRNLIYIICYSFVRYLRVNKTLSYIPFLFHFTHTSNICGGGCFFMLH